MATGRIFSLSLVGKSSCHYISNTSANWLRFGTSMGLPGLDHDTIVQGYMGTPSLGTDHSRMDTVKLVVGTPPHQADFHIPRNYLSSIPYLQMAFTDPRYVEAQSSTIELPEESPGAFKLFVRWLTCGIPTYNTFAPRQLSQEAIGDWVRLLRMLDKWVHDVNLRVNVTKHLTNMLIFIHATWNWKENDPTDPILRRLADYYMATKDNDFRYVFVHFLALDLGFLQHGHTHLDSLEDVRDTNLMFEIQQWTSFLQKIPPTWHIDDESGSMEERKAFGTNDAHTDVVMAFADIRRYLLPLLFDLEPLDSDVILLWTPQGADPAEARQIIRQHFSM